MARVRGIDRDRRHLPITQALQMDKEVFLGDLVQGAAGQNRVVAGEGFVIPPDGVLGDVLQKAAGPLELLV